MLRLQGDACVGSVEGSAGTAKCSVESIPRVELETGLAGPDLQRCRASWVGEPGGSVELLVAVPTEDEVVVVTAGEPELLERFTDPLTYHRPRSKVKRSPVD